MTPDEVLEALKAIILQKLGLLTRQEQLDILWKLSEWVDWEWAAVRRELRTKPAEPTE